MLRDTHFTDQPVMMGREPGESYLRRNMALCRAVDLTKLSIALDDLIEAGLPAHQAECFRANAEALLQLMRTENNRLYAVALSRKDQAG